VAGEQIAELEGGLAAHATVEQERAGPLRVEFGRGDRFAKVAL